MTDLLGLLDELLGWYHSRRTLRAYRAWRTALYATEEHDA